MSSEHNMADLQDLSNITLEQTIAEAERHFQPIMDLIPEPIRASMTAFIRSITQVTFEYMKVCEERWQREVDEELSGASTNLTMETTEEAGEIAEEDAISGRITSLTTESESQDQDAQKEGDDRGFSDSDDDVPEIRFSAPSGVEVDMREVYKVFCEIDADDVEDPEERKLFVEQLVQKCQEHGWI